MQDRPITSVTLWRLPYLRINHVRHLQGSTDVIQMAPRGLFPNMAVCIEASYTCKLYPASNIQVQMVFNKREPGMRMSDK